MVYCRRVSYRITLTVNICLHSVDLYEARAVLLGRMGRHEHTLELYVYKLKNYAKAEEYVFSSFSYAFDLVDSDVDTASVYIIQTEFPEASS